MLVAALLVAYLCTFPYVECGQCCDSHYDLTMEYHDAKWCENYCCFDLGKYDCCDLAFLATSEKNTLPFCVDWFRANIWAPILIAVAALITIVCVACCICCCSCCCGRRGNSGTVVMSPNPQTHVLMMPNHADQKPEYEHI